MIFWNLWRFLLSNVNPYVVAVILLKDCFETIFNAWCARFHWTIKKKLTHWKPNNSIGNVSKRKPGHWTRHVNAKIGQFTVKSLNREPVNRISSDSTPLTHYIIYIVALLKLVQFTFKYLVLANSLHRILQNILQP